MSINGRTKLIPIIGDPVDDVASPPAINARLSELGLDTVMVPFHVPPKALEAFWQLLRESESFIGCSITFPHKRAAFAISDTLTERAHRLGAVNTLRRNPDGTLYGDATDGLALVKAFEDTRVALKGRSVHIVGSGGGAGRAIVDAFCAAGVSTLRLDDINRPRAEETERIVRTAWPDVSISSNIDGDILIDATANGKSLNQVDLFSETALRNCVAACDIAGRHDTSQFLDQARRQGKVTIDARQMGEGQVEAQLGVWLDRKDA